MSHPAPGPAARNAHYERLGGAEAVQRLVEAFYRAMDTRPDAVTIRAMHGADLSETRRILIAYLSEWMGGPKAYSPERGAPMLRRRHYPFDIDAAARDAWMACMHQALAEACTDAALRAELEAAFAKVADFMRNTDVAAPVPPPPPPVEVLPPHDDDAAAPKPSSH